MRDSLSLGTTCPLNVTGIQVDPNKDYHSDMRNEARRFIQMLENRFINFNKIRYKIEACPHDFGTYYDVAVIYDDERDESCDQAFFIESNLPEEWEDLEVFTYPDCI